MPEIVIFVGPSLAVEEARRVLEAEYRPPARRGDITLEVSRGARIIGLIDGVFFQDCSVAHKEIIMALEKGVKVLGSSSMGALRAAEVDVYGMEGVGEIYRLYKDGILESDDEVALIFDPISFQPLSEPLVNIRFNLTQAVEEGILTGDEAGELVAVARNLYFPERTYDRLLEKAQQNLDEGSLERFRQFLLRKGRDLKREDALALLHRIAEIAPSP